MKSSIIYIVLTVLAAALMVIGSCATPAQKAAAASLRSTTIAATEDGFLSAEERQALNSRMQEYEEAPSYDWAKMAATASGAILTTLGLLRVMPNSGIIGKQEALALDKAAGIA
jgi:hypothetical protein